MRFDEVKAIHGLACTSIKTWVDYLHDNPGQLSVSEAASRTLAISPEWTNCVYYWWGDAYIQELVDLYPDQIWKDACAPYVKHCLEDLLDSANWKSTLWRFHNVLKQLGPSFFGLHSDNINLSSWLQIANGTRSPVSEDEHWAALLLTIFDDATFAKKFASLLKFDTVELPVLFPALEYICSRLAHTVEFDSTSVSYPNLAIRLSTSAFAHWLTADIRDLAKPEVLSVLEKAEENVLLRWYVLGLINPRTYTFADEHETSTAKTLFKEYMLKHMDWYKQQPDLVLDAHAYMAETMIGRLGIQTFSWIETWLIENKKITDIEASATMYEMVKNNEVVWWLKPDWLVSKPLFDSLQLDQRSIIEYGRSLEAQPRKLDSTELPSTITF